MSLVRGFAVCLFAVLAAGCAQTLPPPQASLSALEALRASPLPGMRAGEFVADTHVRGDGDARVTIRSVSLSSPYDGSFAKYLGMTIDADLAAAGKRDPSALLVITGILTESRESDGISDGTASLAARFTLTRSGKTVFDKELTAEARWDSSFVGAIAIPDAINNYTALYDKLAIKLFQDPDFIAAATAP